MTVSAERPPVVRTSQKPLLERVIEGGLFRARWLMAPFYVGLVAALFGLLVIFAKEVVHSLSGLFSMTPEEGILMGLSLIDLSLAGNLMLIVIFSGYETFVSRIDTGDDADRPSWMGTVDFSGLKMKLIASIVAISAIALLKTFMKMVEGEAMEDRTLAWMLGFHLTFVCSGVLLALMDWLKSKTAKHEGLAS